MVLHLHLTAMKYNRGYSSMTSFGLFAFTSKEKLNSLMAYLLLLEHNYGMLVSVTSNIMAIYMARKMVTVCAVHNTNNHNYK